MAMSSGGGGKDRRPEINVTPMIDVLLVLIIIFMVIVPPSSHGLDARIPQPPDQTPQQQWQAPNDEVVITVKGDRTVRLNEEVVAVAVLGDRLKSLFGGPANRIIFVRADKNLEFRDVAEVIDIARGAGLDRFALMSK